MATIKIKRGSTDPAVSIAPAGLTAGEPTFNTSLQKLFVHNGSTAIWVGAQIDNDTTLAGNSAIRIPTQFAVKSYVDSQVAGGAVSSVNGVTGAVVLVGGGTYGNTFDINFTTKTIVVRNIGVTAAVAGSGINLNSSTGTVIITNAGVTGIINPTTLGGGTYGIQISQQTGSVVITNTGVSAAAAGSGISISGSTGTVTISNTGVTGITGTANQLTANTNTGFVTFSLPSAITTPGSLTTTTDLTVGGNLVVNGTTTTVNSTTVTIQDPVIVLGGTVGINDTKDRGIQFNYGGGNTGFFGYDNSLARFAFYTSATNTSEVFVGTTGDAQFGNLFLGTGGSVARLTTLSLSADRTVSLPNYSGTFLVPSSEGTSSYIIKSNGAGSQPTWIDPTASGFTAFAATNVTSVEASGTYYLAMASGVGTNQLALDTTATALSYNTATSTLTAGTFSGTLSGNASSATNATNSVNVISTEQTTGTYYLVGMAAAGTTGGLLIDATATIPLSYNVATGTVTCVQVEAIVDGGSY